jgi:hypothetical protein
MFYSYLDLSRINYAFIPVFNSTFAYWLFSYASFIPCHCHSFYYQLFYPSTCSYVFLQRYLNMTHLSLRHRRLDFLFPSGNRTFLFLIRSSTVLRHQGLPQYTTWSVYFCYKREDLTVELILLQFVKSQLNSDCQVGCLQIFTVPSALAVIISPASLGWCSVQVITLLWTFSGGFGCRTVA